MERKIIRQGSGGYTVYLPKKWVTQKGLKEGDLIGVEESKNSLVFSTEVRKRKEKLFKINPDNREDIEVILTHLYRRGFDAIHLEGLDKEFHKRVKKIVEELLLGFEITSKTDTRCTIENISEPTGQKYEALLLKVFLIIKEVQDLVIEDFESGKFQNLDEIRESKRNGDKFILFCRRILTKEKQELDATIEWEMLTFLMHINHAYFYLYEYLKENRIQDKKEILSLLNSLKEYFMLYEKAYTEKNILYIHKINADKKKYQFGKCIEALTNGRGKMNPALSYIRELFRLVQIGASPILIQIIEKDYK
ncbi:Uncharacterised protein [uncultured archaeon]|nr:Uncharacterised protein [uncultured archaeon]